MKNLTYFTFFNDGVNVRVTLIENEPYFALQDVCQTLNINNVTTLRERLDQKGVMMLSTPTNGGQQKMYFIDEKNLYKCIFKSKKKEAEKFQDWVFEDVLPTVRKTGKYDLQC